MASSAIAQLVDDHRKLKDLFDRFEACTPRAHKTMADLRDRIVRELSVHSAIEERVLYPVVIEALPDLEPEVLEGLAEHGVAEQLLAQVSGMDTDDRWFRPKMSVLIENVRHHIDEEEEDLFPQIRESMGRRELEELGEALDEARATAPESPSVAVQGRALLEQVTERAQQLINGLRSKVTVGTG